MTDEQREEDHARWLQGYEVERPGRTARAWMRLKVWARRVARSLGMPGPRPVMPEVWEYAASHKGEYE